MARRMVVFLLPALLFGMGGLWTGCSKKTDCKANCQKMKKCSGEIAKAMAKKMGLPEAQAKGMVKTMKQQLEDVDGCVKKCEAATKGKTKNAEMKKIQKKVEECLAKSSCSAVAECYVKVTAP